uniref:Ovule protein n=1 Tax=Brugia timori TaxID=42155 RepID=A0A0R3R385_9BILA
LLDFLSNHIYSLDYYRLNSKQTKDHRQSIFHSHAHMSLFDFPTVRHRKLPKFHFYQS